MQSASLIIETLAIPKLDFTAAVSTSSNVPHTPATRSPEFGSYDKLKSGGGSFYIIHLLHFLGGLLAVG